MVDLEPPFPACDKKEPYIFASYAHADKAEVYPELARLHGLGYRIWYDEGITPSKSWVREIADAIDDCAFFLVLISPDAIASENVNREITYAIDHKKPYLAVFLRDATLSKELVFLLSMRQHVFKHKLKPADYSGKIDKVLPPATRWPMAAAQKQPGYGAPQPPIWAPPGALPPPVAVPSPGMSKGGGGLLGELKQKLLNNPNAPPEMKMAAMAPQMGSPGPSPMQAPPGAFPPSPGLPMGMPGPMPGPPMGMPPNPMNMPSPFLPVSGPAGSNLGFDFSTDVVYAFVAKMEDFLLSKKNKLEPFRLAQQLGFTDVEIFYNFIVNLNREDLIRFDGGKVVVAAMSPVDTEEFLNKFQRYLETGIIS
jgi:hypothetical protein